MLIKKTLLATTLLLGLTKAYTGCSVHDHLCSYHALGTPTTSYNQNQDTSLVIFSAATQVGGGTNNTVDFDNHVLLPDQAIDLSTGQVSSTEPFVYSTTSYGANNPSEISEWNTADTQPRHVYPSQYRVDFNQLTATAKHTGDYNGGEKDNIPDATGCPNLGVNSPNCEAVVINKNVPTGIYSQKVQMFNFHELDDPSAEIVVGAYATGQGTIISQSHLPSGATTAATNPADATLTESGVVYQTINLSGDQAQSGQFDYAFYNRGFDPHASGTLSFDHKVYHDKGYKTYNKYDYKTNTVNTYREQYYAYDTNRQTIDGATGRVNNQIVQYGKTHTSTPKIINTHQLPTIGIYENNSFKQVSTENASFNPLTQRWEQKNTPVYGPHQENITPNIFINPVSYSFTDNLQDYTSWGESIGNTFIDTLGTSIEFTKNAVENIQTNMAMESLKKEKRVLELRRMLDKYHNNFKYSQMTLFDKNNNVVDKGASAAEKELEFQVNIREYENLTGKLSIYPKIEFNELEQKSILNKLEESGPYYYDPYSIESELLRGKYYTQEERERIKRKEKTQEQYDLIIRNYNKKMSGITQLQAEFGAPILSIGGKINNFSKNIAKNQNKIKITNDIYLPSNASISKPLTIKEANKLTGENKGLIFVYEGKWNVKNPKNFEIFEAGTTGALTDIKTRKKIVPALRYDNPNPRGYNFIKLDGFETNGYLIDRKTNLTTFKTQIYTLEKLNIALKQNPSFKVVYEFPTREATKKARKILEKYNITHIKIRTAK